MTDNSSTCFVMLTQEASGWNGKACLLRLMFNYESPARSFVPQDDIIPASALMTYKPSTCFVMLTQEASGWNGKRCLLRLTFNLNRRPDPSFLRMTYDSSVCFDDIQTRHLLCHADAGSIWLEWEECLLRLMFNYESPARSFVPQDDIIPPSALMTYKPSTCFVMLTQEASGWNGKRCLLRLMFNLNRRPDPPFLRMTCDSSVCFDDIQTRHLLCHADAGSIWSEWEECLLRLMFNYESPAGSFVPQDDNNSSVCFDDIQTKYPVLSCWRRKHLDGMGRGACCD